MKIYPRSGQRARGVMLVADDFAITGGVSRAILGLAAAGRITGTGAMTVRPHWPGFARELAALGDVVDVGLHLTLTLGRPCAAMPDLCPSGLFPPLTVLMRRAFAGALPRAEIEAEIERQVEAFAEHFGRLPDFLDGHQHVHVLPGVRSALLAVIARRWTGRGRPWLRDPSDTPGAILARGIAVPKALVVAATALGWRQRLARAGIPANRGFSGFSPFDPRRDFGEDLAAFLSVPGERHLVMCHPGEVDDELATLDPVVATRAQELALLAGDRLDAILADQALELRRFWAFAEADPGGADT